MAVWNDRWFGGQAMPPYGFPRSLIGAAQILTVRLATTLSRHAEFGTLPEAQQ